MTNASSETLLRLGETAVRERHDEARRRALAHAASPRRRSDASTRPSPIARLARLLGGRARGIPGLRRTSEPPRVALGRDVDGPCEACA